MRAVWIMPFVLGACGAAPLSNPAPRATTADIEIGQVEVAEPAVGDPAPKGVFSLFRPAPEAPEDPVLAEAEGAEATGAVEADVLAEPDTPAEVQPTPKRGLFGLLAAAPPEVAAEPAEDAAPVQTAGLAPRKGLFGGGGGKAKADSVPPGTALPFGQVARVCSARKSDLGKEVDKRGKWRLYDTIPNSAAPRVMYVTGFDDKCAQMFTAALVLFGSATAHETVRYTTRGAYSETDEAYEKIKGRICGVKRGSACPADRLDKLEDQVTFLTAYPGFGATGGPWLDLLLHKGDLAASGLNKR